MKETEAIKILTKVKLNWNRQPVDELIAAEWVECLTRVSFESALEAVRDMRDSGQAEAPTPGEVYVRAKASDDRRADTNRSFIRALPPPKPSEEEKARVRELLETLGVKIKSV